MREYDDAMLRKIQRLELDILKEVDGICRELGISYFAIAGTGIGVKRHKGFIPWDDDIDVGMLRDDLNKLIEYIKTNYNKKYIVINNDEYNDFPLMTTQLALRDTNFVVEEFKDLKIPFGIYLDIFPFDNIPDNEFLMKFFAIRIWIISKFLILRHIPKPCISMTGWKKKLIYFITSTVHGLMKLLNISSRKLYMKALKLSTKYNGIKTQRVGHCGCERYDLLIMDHNEIFPLADCSFEDMKIMTPNALEVHLKKAYGDYMQLPPEEKRKNHFPYELNFGRYN